MNKKTTYKLIEIAPLFNDPNKPNTDSYGIWMWIISKLDRSHVVEANEREKEYGMSHPMLFLLHGDECTVESSGSFHHKNTRAIVVFNRTRDRVQKKCYRRM